jgi:hypothetical protein
MEKRKGKKRAYSVPNMVFWKCERTSENGMFLSNFDQRLKNLVRKIRQGKDVGVLKFYKFL